eukprot:gb/GEZN01010912.1/.p1 GENE.gb/GEZN01010912.1/~~gb/GEZN01010912.1/.p1  ORF type:complete len:286 (-),score=31.24 gb/GEZN01010912.1/:267-1124(-)
MASPISNVQKVMQSERGGFDFSNCKRNEMLQRMGMKMPRAFKTGTTIVGIVYNDGVVLGADTRATEGPIVCDKNCEKIHHITKRIWCCGAGTSADTENVTGLISSQLELHRLESGSEPRVVTALTRLKQYLFKYQGHVSAALVLGGVDSTGAHLYTVYPHGSTDRLPFATMGSGSLAAMAVFEANYKDGMEEKEAIELVSQAIQAGIFNDLGSGSNVDICVISKSRPEPTMLRTYVEGNPRLYRRKAGYDFPKGSTDWLKGTEQILKTKIQVTTVIKKKKKKSAA